MNLNPKVYIAAAVLFLITSIIGGYFSVTRTKSLITEQSAHEATQNKLDMAEAFITMKEAALNRAYAKRTTSKPVLLDGKIAYEKTSETLGSEESRTMEYTTLIERLQTEKLHLSQELDSLRQVETSKAGVKRWNAGAGWLNTVGVYETLGYRQDLGLIDIGIQGLTNIPAFNVYGGAFTVGF